MLAMGSRVEEQFLSESAEKLRYGDEKISCIVVPSFPELGRITALRFLEWAQHNPDGVVSLPTGKTPEYFIKEVNRYLSGWNEEAIQKELISAGIDAADKPHMGNLHFVQIDEFYPINPLQHNSFYYYVKKYYIEGFGLDPEKALLINCNEIGLQDSLDLEAIWRNGEVDLTLRYRKPTDKQERLQKELLERIDEWCIEYEHTIRSMGGIGFFLGGIGPDGHIGFNIRGSDFFSTTRLTRTNYETQAAAAQDLGGMEIAGKRLVITIGLSTITFNSSCVAIITAAGEAKAEIVSRSILGEKSIHFPASALHDLPEARFYLSRGAAKKLTQRNIAAIASKKNVGDDAAERIIIDVSLQQRIPVARIEKRHLQSDGYGKLLLSRSGESLSALKDRVISNLEEKINSGIQKKNGRTFLHTEPHHDDIMLGYLPGVVRHIRDHSTKHCFVTFTSGFTAVTNRFMLNIIADLKDLLERHGFDELHRENYFDPQNTTGRNRDVWQYLDGVAADSLAMQNEGRLRRLLRNLIALYEENDIEQIRDRIAELINYFQTQYPGKKDLDLIQKLKGMCREWEGDCLWGYFGWHSDSVHHLRLGFYTGDIFTQEPTIERDVTPITTLLRKVQPDVVSVALDPEASGPDTHYKVLQALSEALALYAEETGRRDIEVWGYRNVWYRFHPSEADMYIPVSLNMFALQDNAFKNSFLSQRDASFPSYEYDGPFSELAQHIQVEQYQMLKNCLGREFFNEHQSALLRATRGMVFLKSMSLDELYRHSRKLKKLTENL
jgi:glucosamine-6-phosphate deaminase